MKLYLAYGANTNLANMTVRCPEAKYVCNVTLAEHRLVFRGVADIVASRGNKVVCAMWAISPKDEEALDRFEGFPNLYVKRYVTIHIQGQRHRVMFYVMRTRRYEAAPSERYEQTLRVGYVECGMPEAQIDLAIKRAKAWTKANGQVEGVGHGSWSMKPTKPVTDSTLTEEEEANDEMNQLMFDWYSAQSKGE